MGYTTDFKGSWDLDKPLASEHAEYLKAFVNTRRMARIEEEAEKLPDPVRTRAKLPIGPQGAYFVGGTGIAGQDRDVSVIDENGAPAGQPGLWCQWVPTEDNKGIEWDGGEKFYNYTEWIQYLIKHFLKPWGYKLNGKVEWRGEDFDDLGTIKITNNKVEVTPK